MKNLLFIFFVALFGILLSGCNSKEVWESDYDLSTEIGREMHCYAQFQKNVKADSYGAEWLNEVNNGFGAIVEGKITADGEEYNLVCNYSDDLGDWTIDYTPVNEPESGNPASEYCLNNGGSYEIVSNETSIYGECTFDDGSSCEEWDFYDGECMPGDNLTEETLDGLQFDLDTEEGRKVACEERAGFYLNFNEGTFTWEDESEGGASFVRNGHVAYLKWGENAEDDVECLVDVVDKSVNVEFSNHIYNGELQD